MPNIFIIAGCNGPGKATASFTILPEMLNCNEFVNADEIAKGLSPFRPETVSFQAGRIMLQRINELLEERVDFAFETTLTTLSYLQTIERAREVGYSLILIYFWLNDVNLAIERVKSRILEGGHSIPEEIIIRRYFRGVHNLITRFTDICHYWIVIDNSTIPFTFVAEGGEKQVISIHNQSVWQKMKSDLK